MSIEEEQELLTIAHSIRTALLERGWDYLDPLEEFAQGYLVGVQTVMRQSGERETEGGNLVPQGMTRTAPYSQV